MDPSRGLKVNRERHRLSLTHSILIREVGFQ